MTNPKCPDCGGDLSENGTCPVCDTERPPPEAPAAMDAGYDDERRVREP